MNLAILRVSLKWGKAEDKGEGMCSTSGDEAGMQSFVDAHSAEVSAYLAGGTLPTDVSTCNGSLALRDT